MTEPSRLVSALAEQLARFSPGSRQYDLRLDLLNAERQCRERRTAVLKYPDLAQGLCESPLSYLRPGQWNGWIPPALINPESDEELCRVLSKTGIMRMNQVGHRGTGEMQNDSPRRHALLTLASEAWKREHPPEAEEAS